MSSVPCLDSLNIIYSEWQFQIWLIVVFTQVLHESHSRMVYFEEQWYNKAVSSETCGK